THPAKTQPPSQSTSTILVLIAAPACSSSRRSSRVSVLTIAPPRHWSQSRSIPHDTGPTAAITVFSLPLLSAGDDGARPLPHLHPPPSTQSPNPFHKIAPHPLRRRTASFQPLSPTPVSMPSAASSAPTKFP